MRLQRGTRETPLPRLRKMVLLPGIFLPFLFLVFPHTLFLGGVCFNSFFSFPSFPSCCSPLLPISHFSVTSCHSSLPPVLHLAAATRDGFCSAGQGLCQHRGLPAPAPAPGASCGTDAGAGVAMARLTLVGESFCCSRQDNSYIIAM